MKFALALLSGIADKVENFFDNVFDPNPCCNEEEEDEMFDFYYYNDRYSEEANVLAHDLFYYMDADRDWVLDYNELIDEHYEWIQDYTDFEMYGENYDWLLYTFDALDEHQYGLEGFIYYDETIAAADELLASHEICFWNCDSDCFQMCITPPDYYISPPVAATDSA